MRWRKANWMKWHLWFAWCPVAVGEEWVWWEDLERKADLSGLGCSWTYRTPGLYCRHCEKFIEAPDGIPCAFGGAHEPEKVVARQYL